MCRPSSYCVDVESSPTGRIPSQTWVCACELRRDGARWQLLSSTRRYVRHKYHVLRPGRTFWPMVRDAHLEVELWCA